MARRNATLILRDKSLGEVMELRQVVADVAALRLAAWSHAVWKANLVFELIAVRAYTVWEGFSHRLLVLTLAKDTSALSLATQLKLPRVVTADLADALLTARGYLEFKDVGDLVGKAGKWLAASPFDALKATRSLHSHRGRIDDLKVVRNAIVHRSRQSAAALTTILAREGLRRDAPPGDFMGDGTPTRLERTLLDIESVVRGLV